MTTGVYLFLISVCANYMQKPHHGHKSERALLPIEETKRKEYHLPVCHVYH